MTAVSAVPALLATLAATLDAAVACPVFDGPGLTDDSMPDYLLVGVPDPDADSPDNAVETEVEWGALGRLSRVEHITIRCTAVSWSGDEDLAALRVRAYATLGAVEQALTADPSLGDNARYGGLVASHQMRQNTDADGAVVWVLFSLSFTARLSG